MSENNNKQNGEKLHLVNFIRLVNQFVPVLDKSLVNETTNPQGWNGEYQLKSGVKETPPNIHQFINAAFAAIGDIKQFIKDHEQAKSDLLQLRDDAIKVHRLLMGAGMSVNAMSEGVEILFRRFKQCLDIINHSTTIPPEKLNAFQANARDFVLRFTQEDKANTIFDQTGPSQLPSTPTILESQVKPDGGTGENPNSSN